MRLFLRLSALVGAVIGAQAVRGQSAAAIRPDASLNALVRNLVRDSLIGGGVRAAQRYLAADSISLAFLADAAIPVDSIGAWSSVTCPGSTTATGDPFPSPVGYRVNVSVKPSADTSAHLLAVSKTCAFVYRGAPNRMGGGFGEGAIWEIRRTNGTWRVTRRLNHVIT